jgi:hypothetical protein
VWVVERGCLLLLGHPITPLVYSGVCVYKPYIFTVYCTIYLNWLCFSTPVAFELGKSADTSAKLGKINFIINKFKIIANIIFLLF